MLSFRYTNHKLVDHLLQVMVTDKMQELIRSGKFSQAVLRNRASAADDADGSAKFRGSGVSSLTRLFSMANLTGRGRLGMGGQHGTRPSRSRLGMYRKHSGGHHAL